MKKGEQGEERKKRIPPWYRRNCPFKDDRECRDLTIPVTATAPRVLSPVLPCPRGIVSEESHTRKLTPTLA